MIFFIGKWLTIFGQLRIICFKTTAFLLDDKQLKNYRRCHCPQGVKNSVLSILEKLDEMSVLFSTQKGFSFL
jgi:hypothetical protein